MSFNHDKFKKSGGVRRYGYGIDGWAKAREDYEQRKRSMRIQKWCIVGFVTAMLGAVVFILCVA